MMLVMKSYYNQSDDVGKLYRAMHVVVKKKNIQVVLNIAE